MGRDSVREDSGRRRGNGSKLEECSFRLDIGKKFFPFNVVRPWHRKFREAMVAPGFLIFKVTSNLSPSMIL